MLHTVGSKSLLIQGISRDSGKISASDTVVVNEQDSLSTSATIEVTDMRHDGIKIPFTMEQTDGVFGLLLLCFLFFAHVYNGGLTFLKENTALLLSPEKNQRIHKQTTTSELLYSYFLLFQVIVLLSLCLYDVFLKYDTVRPDHYGGALVTILVFIIVLSLFISLKNVMYKVLAYIFDADAVFSVWKRAYTISLEILGIIYFVPTLFLIFANAFHLQIIIFMLVLFLIVQLLLFYQIIIFFIREKFNFLYLIAYLCTFEILPYVFLYLGLRYLYRFDVFNLLWP